MYIYLITPQENKNDKYVYVHLMTGYKLSQYYSVIKTKSTVLMHEKQCIYVS